MAYYTQNLNLKKPAQTDFYDVDDFNGNMDKVDEAIVNYDCGTWEDVSLLIEAHNANPLAHSNITVDGMVAGLLAHDENENAHPNLQADGGNI